MVNSKNLIISQPHKKNLPYLETLNFITKTSENLISTSESQFIDYLHIQNDSLDLINVKKLNEIIADFDFALGTPLVRQFAALAILKSLHHEIKNLAKTAHYHLSQQAGLNINTINENPSRAVKATRSLLFLDQKALNYDSEFEYFEGVLEQLSKQAHLSHKTNKQELRAPLHSWEEDKIKNLFYIILTRLELICISLHYSLEFSEYNKLTDVFYLKENFLSLKMNDLYEKTSTIAEHILIKITTEQILTTQDATDTKKFENESFIERIGFHLSSLNEKKEEISILQENMRKLLKSSDIKFDELIDDEIHNINIKISKEKITRARLEMRLNDTEYPLSVAYRNFIMSLLVQRPVS